MVAGLDDIVLAVVTKGTGPVVSKIIKELTDRQAETLKLLNGLKRDVGAILHGPFNTGMAYLREADNPNRSASATQESLKLARQEFMRALGQERDPLTRGEVGIYLAAVWLALGELSQAQFYAAQATVDLGKGIAESVSQRNEILVRSGTLRGVTWSHPPTPPTLEVWIFWGPCKRLKEANRIAYTLGTPVTELFDITVDLKEGRKTLVGSLLGPVNGQYRFTMARVPFSPPPGNVRRRGV